MGVMAIILKRPDSARARPSSLIKRDEDYLKLFNTDHPIEVYRTAAQILKKTEAFLNSHQDSLSAADKNNLKFYMAMAISQMGLSKFDPSAQDISSLANTEIEDDLLSMAYELVNNAYSELGRTDKVSKGSGLVERVKQCLRDTYPPQYG